MKSYGSHLYASAQIVFFIWPSISTYKQPQEQIGDINMLETIAIILVILWALGLISSYSMGGLIHVLLVIAVVVLLVRVLQGRRL
jgi:hypothetical protein